jgi:hypothetical protein
MKKEFEYNLEYFRKCLVEEDEFEVKPSKTWSDDAWYMDQENRKIKKNEGFIVLNKGEASGIIFGGNLGSFHLLQGTEFFPNISNSILFIEECDSGAHNFTEEFSRLLQSLIHQPNFEKVKGLVIGRFQKASKMTKEKLEYLGKFVFQSGKNAKDINYKIITSDKITSYPALHETLIEADCMALDSPWKFATLCEEAVSRINELLLFLKRERTEFIRGDGGKKPMKGWID